MNFSSVVVSAGALSLGLFSPAFAQNTGGIFGPIVNEGHHSAQYRITYDPDTERYAQRLHYQHALNGELMVRVIGQARKTASSDFDPDFLKAELFWQITPDGQPWQTGLRFDASLRDGNRSDVLGLNWTNQWRISDTVSVRAIVLTSLELGDMARDGIGLGTRAGLFYREGSGPEFAFEMFNSYGTTDDIADLEDQRHQIGPAVNLPVSNGWSIYGSALFGVTDATPDTELRIRLTKRL